MPHTKEAAQRKSLQGKRKLALIGLVVVVATLVAWEANSGALSSRWPLRDLIATFNLGEQNMSVSEEKVLHANESTFGEMVLRSNVPVLVDFYADWCGPCQRIAPVLEQLAGELPNVKIVKVNVDQSPGLATTYGIDSIPNLLLFKNGEVANQLVGLASKSQLKALLDSK